MNTTQASFSRATSLAKRGFTLIEILVATAIMIILIGIVVQITGEVLKVWNNASGKLAANAEARIAMDLITRDLEAAVIRNNGQQWIRVDGPVDVSGAPYDSQTVALKLFTPALDRQRLDIDGVTPIAGDICAVAYRLEYQEAYGDSNIEVFALYRAIERPDNTFNELLGSSSDASSPQLSLDTSPAFWTPEEITKEENYLASNIVDFKVLIYEDDGFGTPNPLPVNVNDDFVLDANYAYGGDPRKDSAVSTKPLLYADIILTIISDEGMKILQNISEGRVTEYTGLSAAEDLVREKGQVFTRRIHFSSRGF